MSFWGTVIGGIGGSLVGGLLGNKGANDAAQTNQETAEKYNTHAILEQMSGGKYSSYLKNYAFGSPGDQGRFAREYMKEAFPNMNEWELAGTPTAGVAGSMGASATDTASQNSQQQSAMAMEAAKQNTQLKMAQMQTKAQIATASIGAFASMKNAETSADASIYGTDVGASNVEKQMAPQMAKLDAELGQINAQTLNINSNTDLAKANTVNAINESLLFKLKETGIQLDNEQKQMVMEKMKVEIRNLSNSQSQVGKTISDLTSRFKEVVEETVSATESPFRKVLDKFDEGQQWIHDQWGKFRHGENYHGVGGATTGQGRNGYRRPSQSVH